MNFYASTSDGDRDGGFSLIHPDSHHADAIVVPDAELLFTGNFHRSGSDLVLTGHDGRHHVIPGYFSSEHPPALVAPNGAHLSPDVVDLLAGSPAPNEYAQAQTQTQTTASPDSIGKVQKIAGTVTVLRNGVSVAVNVGDVVYKSDVLVTGADSKCGVTFPDGTALELLPNTRMALNEYAYDASSTSNQALFTLVEGTFGFVAGKVAHTGDMKIGTPVATMGIRGTTGVVQFVGSNAGNVTYSYSVYDDPGSTNSGSWDMFVQNPDGTQTLIATVSQTGYVTFVTPQGIGLPPLVTTVPLTASQVAADQLLIQELFEVYGLGGPHSIGIPGSGDNPLLQLPPNFFPDVFGNGGSFASNGQLSPLPGPQPPQDPQGPTNTTSNIFIWSSPNNQNFPIPSFWNQGAFPTSANDIVIILTGTSQYPASFDLIFYSLAIDGPLQNGGLPPGELNMIGGELIVTNGLTVGGELLLGGDPPRFLSYGTATILSGGQVIADGKGSTIKFMPNPSNPGAGSVIVENLGLIRAQDGGIIKFIDSLVTNEPAPASTGDSESTPQPGVIEATGKDALVKFKDSIFFNAGFVAAEHGGTVEFVDRSTVNNDPGSINTDSGAETAPGKIESIDCGSLVLFKHSSLDNFGLVAAEYGGRIEFLHAGIVTNAPETTPPSGGDIENPAGEIESTGRGSDVSFIHTDLDNFGLVVADSYGAITFRGGATITNESSLLTGATAAPAGRIEAEYGGFIGVDGGKVVNDAGANIDAKYGGLIDIGWAKVTNDSGARIEASDHGEIKLFDARLDNQGTVVAEDCGCISIVGCDDGSVINVGLIEAKSFGEVKFDGLGRVVNDDGGKIEAEDHGTVLFEDVAVTNFDKSSDSGGGLIAADGCGSTVELSNALISHGTVQSSNGGKIEAVYGDNEFRDVTINGGIVQVDCHAALALEGNTVIENDTTFEGPGVFVLDRDDSIIGDDSAVTLRNDSTIAGSGSIGGNGLTLINERCGTILAIDGSGDPLIIHTGSNKITNDGLLEASWCGVLDIESKLGNYGRVIATHGGEVVADANVVNKEGALIEAEHGGTVTLDDIKIGNDFCAVIEAKGDYSTVFIGGSPVDNAGTIEAKYGGTVSITDSTIHNECGLIAAFGYGAIVELTNSTVYGGTLSTGDPCSPCFGVIEITSGANTVVFDGSGQEVTVDGFVQVDPGATLELIGTIDNKGTIDVDGESGADLEISGTVKLDGRGDVVLDGRHDEIIGASAADSSAKLENSSEISGYGKIDSNDGSLKLDNKADGVVDADVRHEKLVIETGNFVSNAGLLEASHGGVLVIKDDVNNKGGAIDAHSFSTVVVDGIAIDNTDDGANDGAVEAHGCGATVVLYDGADIIGGTLSTSDGGLIEIANKPGHTHSDVIFDGAETAAGGTILPLTIDGLVRVDENTALTLLGTIHNDGVIDVDGESGADLQIEGTVKLDGSGDVVLDGRNDEITGAPTDDSDSAKLDNFSEISGQGKIGSDGDGLLTLDNKADGVVDANVRHEKLVIETGNTVTNEGLLEATSGGVLDIKDDVDNKGGTIGAYDAGSLVKLFGITVTGGTLETGDPYWRDDGLIEVMATCAMTVFDGSQQHDPVTVAGFVQVDPGAQLELKGTIDLDGGAIELDQATRHETVNGSNLVIDGTVTLDGFGDVALEGNGTGIVGAWCDGGTLINNSSIYGSRGGFIGTGDDSLTFINNNIVDSEAGHAGPLVIDTGCNIVTNTGTLEATGSSELDLYGSYANQNGTIAASEDGSGPSVVKLFGATIEGGTLVTDGGDVAADGSTIEIVAGYGVSVFDGSDQKVTVDAYVNVDAGAQLELIGTIQDIGIINVDGAVGADLIIDGTVKLNGGGEVILSGTSDSIIGAGGDEDAGNTLVNSDTIAGYGNIGNDESTDLSLTNKGTIDADVSGQDLTIHTGHAVDNQGTLEASSGGILQIDDAVHNSGSGSALIAAGTLDFASTTNVNEVTFDNGSGTPSYGELILGDVSPGYSATISGFAGTAADLHHSDAIYLTDFFITSESETSTASGTIVTWDLHDGSDAISLTFDNLSGTLNFAADANGTLITDPPPADTSANITAAGTLSFADNDAATDLSANVTPEGSGYVGNLTVGAVSDSNGTASVDYGFSLGNDQITVAPGQTVTQSYQVSLADAQNPAANASQTVSVSIGGAGNDNFVFAPGVGSDTVLNFNPQQDTIELDHFANAQTVQELQALITTDAHGDAVIDLGHNDSITLANTTTAQLQQAIQNGHVLLH
jgi:FecR protein